MEGEGGRPELEGGTKTYADKARLCLVVPEGKQWDKVREKWKPLLEKLMVTKLLLPDFPLYQRDPEEAHMRSVCKRKHKLLTPNPNPPPPPPPSPKCDIQFQGHRGLNIKISIGGSFCQAK